VFKSADCAAHTLTNIESEYARIERRPIEAVGSHL
jgi:hypothetical protein